MNGTVSGQIVDLFQRRIFSGTVIFTDGVINSIKEEPTTETSYILPGFVDAHIHIESSMLVPSEFARLAVVHGTVATVSDPHEIANVLGLEGVRYMIENSRSVPFHFFFGASPCVPATSFETAGASITPDDIRTLFEKENLKYLSEMMNYPGVLNKDPDVMEKIKIAQAFQKPIDGHAPGLKGKQAQNYIAAGISTDHECFTLEEALDKIRFGMKIIIREGSAAKNFEALHPLLKQHPDKVMFCSDDKHPNDLVAGHLNDIVKRSIMLGYDLFNVLRSACLYPVEHYDLDVGLLKVGDPADFIVVNDLHEFNVKATYVKGELVAEDGKSFIPPVPIKILNQFNASKIKVEELKVAASGDSIRIIEVVSGELITKKLVAKAKIENGFYVADPSRDILKLVVMNRYKNVPPAVAFIHGMGLKEGALASSVAHDSHNIIATGTDDVSICKAINALIDAKGGVTAVGPKFTKTLALPVAGLMSDREGSLVAKEYASIKHISHDMGSSLPDPFMTLSFLALLVIPSIKLSDKGLFDGDSFSFISLNA